MKISLIQKDYVVEITNNRLVIKHILDDDEVYDYVKTCGINKSPYKTFIEFLCLPKI